MSSACARRGRPARSASRSSRRPCSASRNARSAVSVANSSCEHSTRYLDLVMPCRADDLGDAVVHRAQEGLVVRRVDQPAGAGPVDQPSSASSGDSRSAAATSSGPRSGTEGRDEQGVEEPARRGGAAVRSARNGRPAERRAHRLRPPRRRGRSRNGNPAVAAEERRTSSGDAGHAEHRGRDAAHLDRGQWPQRDRRALPFERSGQDAQRRVVRAGGSAATTTVAAGIGDKLGEPAELSGRRAGGRRPRRARRPGHRRAAVAGSTPARPASRKDARIAASTVDLARADAAGHQQLGSGRSGRESAAATASRAAGGTIRRPVRRRIRHRCGSGAVVGNDDRRRDGSGGSTVGGRRGGGRRWRRRGGRWRRVVGGVVVVVRVVVVVGVVVVVVVVRGGGGRRRGG